MCRKRPLKLESSLNYKTDIPVVMVTEGPDALLLLPRRSKKTFW